MEMRQHLQVMKEPGRICANTSYIWIYWTSGCTERPIVLYEYQPSLEKKESRKTAVSPAKRVTAREKEQRNERARPHTVKR